jgi:PhnB protein
MSERDTQSSFTPEGWHTVTPRIVTRDPKQLVDFIKHVFETTGEYRTDRPVTLSIGDSIVMISDTGARETKSAFLYVYVADADATYRRAIQAGAKSIEEPANVPYGDRRAMVEDPWGNTWQIATYRGDNDAA